MPRGLTILLLSASLQGCFLWTSASQGETLRAESDAHEERIAQLERQQDAQLAQLKKADEQARKSREELEQVIDRATTVIQRNSADALVTVSELETKLSMIDGRLAELEHALESLKGNQTSLQTQVGGSVAPEEIPKDKAEHYAAAYRAYTERDFNKARSLFRAFTERYGKDSQADNAQYWIGASYLVENRPATALAELRKVLEGHRDGDAVDEALLDMAEAFYRLRACSDARTALNTLIKTQPRSPLVAKAKQKLKDIRSAGKDYCKS